MGANYYIDIARKLKKDGLDKLQNVSDLLELARHSKGEKEKLDKWERVIAREALNAAAVQARAGGKHAVDFYELYKRSLLFLAPHDFDSFLIYVEMNRAPEKRFYMPRRKVLKVVADDLQALEDGELKLLSISLPVRTGKSTMGCFFMSWLMGKYPDQPSVMSGHSGKLTKSFFTEVLSILTDPQYLWQDVFPKSRVFATSAEDESISMNKAMRYPTLTCRSIGGTLTGAVEAEKCLYCDDLIEDLEESLNPIRLENKYNAYLNQLKDRKKETAYEVHIGTRWAVNDVQGRIEEQYRDDPQYRFRVIPALDENDESNFDYPFGLGFSTEYYHDMRDTIDDATWSAKFLGVPYEREGLLFPPDELNYYNGSLPDGEPHRIVAACDVAWGGGDSLCMPIAYIYGDDVYVHDVVFNRGDKEITRPVVVGKLKQHVPHQVRFEANSGGDEYADKVDELLRAEGVHISISHRKAPTTMSKLSRIIQVAPDIKRFHFRHFKHSNKEYRDFMRELTSFIITGKNKNDDAPDALALLVNLIYYGRVGVEVFERPY